jgi:hypothetical protein
MSNIRRTKFYAYNGLKIIVQKSYWDVPELRDNPDLLYVFGDNLLRMGHGGQAIVRDEPNAIGIATKKSPREFMSDAQYNENITAIKNDIRAIIERALNENMTIVLSYWGYGTGLAMLDKYAPKTWLFLCEILMNEFKFKNKVIS